MEPEKLRAEHIRGVILDLDNTLVDWNEMYVRPQVRSWIESIHQLGMQTCLVSNSVRGRRVRKIGALLDMDVVTKACKPFPIAFRRAMRLMGTRPDSTCAIGDQVFTDMLGANWLGLKTILISPLSRRESPHTQVIRLIERPLRNRWAKAQSG